MCETKNNVWKKHELSILNGIDNCIKITKSKLDSASLNNGHLSHKSLFYWDCGSFILLRDVNVMLRMMCHYFSCSKWALFSWCAASCKSAIENSCKLKVQSNMVANRVIKCELHWNWCLNMIEFGTWNSHDRNGNGSHGNRLYLREECTNRKNLYRSCVGMPPVILLLKS